ncbi:phospholipase D-like domain-containing protein [Enterobacter asburiae]|uniref:phospholipase D-like domain-containing protein n=1 Tax=Enterobacter asburiae TaxID=61645 RepID=UPI003F5469CA
MNNTIKRITLALFLTLPVISLQARAEPAFSVGFSPSNTAMTAVLDVINHASQTLNVEAYSFTSKDIAQALVAARKRGVKVRLMADKKGNSHYSAVTFLANNGVPVRLNNHYAIMHNKVILADGQTLETGSFNYVRHVYA